MVVILLCPINPTSASMIAGGRQRQVQDCLSGWCTVDTCDPGPLR